ncbi:MAG: sulfotransferase family protein [Actinomycetota bacterium]
MIEAIEPLAVGLELTPAALMDQARAESGLDDFGPTDFVERLDVYCTALREEAGLSALGWFNNHSQLVKTLRNRLQIEALVARVPEILDLEIAAPVIICGLPRTGTTHLHNLISADPAMRSLPYWESLEPVPADSEQVAPGEPDPRIERCQMGLDFMHAAMPHFDRMHEMTVDHVHEEIQLLMIDLSTMLMETSVLVPSWAAYYAEHDQTSSYRYMRKVLQCCQHLRGGERWVLKSPQHLEQFPVLVDVFPDATFVVTHRDPVAVTASMTTMVNYGARMSVAHPDPSTYGAYWGARLERMLHACTRDRDTLPEDRSLDVRFDEFMADEFAMVERIYDLAGQPTTEAGRAAMDRFVAEHPRGRHGTVDYDITQFGLDPAERRAALRFYSDRFAVPDEP